ncbi:MAG: zinc dependent phospholipase C family protein [Proteobacteria bacterium]|nr:zinc dependent phospholipase C family protein [Pseudomonadota bacterium]
MPKYGVHSIIMEEAAAKSTAEIKTLLQAYRGAALLGSVGPDLLFFSPEYKAFNFFIQMAHNLKYVKKIFGDVKDAINKVIEPIEEAIEEYAAPIVETIDTIETILPLSCLSGLVDDVKDAAGTLKSAIQDTLMTGVDGGIDLINDAVDIPSFSHSLFDDLFTPAHQFGKREWEWYWFDMLHYRNTGLFAKNLVKLATSDIQKAYALGYLTHVAADTVGHAFVNRIVCGPYRLHPQRHVIIENFIDSATYHDVYGVSVNKALNSDLLSAMETGGVCSVDDYSGYVESFNSEIRDLIYDAFKATYPEDPTTPGDTHAPRPGWLSKNELEKTFENFHVTLSILRDAYVEKPEGLDERYQDVADTLNDILSNFKAPPSPPDTGNTGFCLSLECVGHFLENVAEWMAYFGELAAWTFETIVNALDLLLELACEAAIAVVRAVLYLVEYLSYELYQHMHFVLSLNGYVCPEPTHAKDDPRGEVLLHTGKTARTLIGSCSLVQNPPVCTSAYPRQHDHMRDAVNPPDSATETPATFFPHSADDYAQWYIRNAPWTNMAETLTLYAEAKDPSESRFLANPNNPDSQSLGNAVDFSVWMMEQALEIKEQEQEIGAGAHPLSHIVFCNWDLDSDRGYGYKQWYTTKTPSTSPTDLDETFLDETLGRG